MAKTDDVQPERQTIELVGNPSGSWTARDEAVALYRGEIGHEPTDEELRELGVDPEVARSQDGELPDALE
jgi:hypothetical protein